MDTYVYVGNLPFDITENQLKELFDQIGTVEEVRLAYNPEEGPTKGLFLGYAFIKMNSVEEVEKAIIKLEGHELGGRSIHLEPGKDCKDLWERAFTV